jgi:hypothetical protein
MLLPMLILDVKRPKFDVTFVHQLNNSDDGQRNINGDY